MNDLFQKILSKLPKQTLIVILMACVALLTRYWYKDYTDRQDALKIDLNTILNGQAKIKSDVSDEFRSLHYGINVLQQGQAAINLKLDIVKKLQPVQIQKQIEQVDNLVEQLTVKEVQESVPEYVQPKDAKLDHTIIEKLNNQGQRDTVIKKSFLNRLFSHK
jgi:hypothetical protein